MSDATTDTTRTAQPLSIALWIVQASMCVLFAGTGVWKLVTPIEALAATFPWMGEVPSALVRGTGVIDLLGGIGVLLPSLMRFERLTVLAALGCAALQVAAIVFHVSRGEAASTPFNFFLVALALFVAWGRSRAPLVRR